MGNLIINLSSVKQNSEGKIFKDIQVPLTETFDANFDTNAVKQSLKNIFEWRRGERILDPLFGNIIYDYVYEPINDITIRNLRDGIIRMLQYEPRINVISLDITPSEDQNTIYVLIKYIIPKLNIIDSYSINVNIVSF